MADDCSVISSCYWDVTSIMSDGTIPTDQFHTPMGSLMDMCNSEHYTSDSDRGSITPTFYDMKVMEEKINKEIEIEIVETKSESIQSELATIPFIDNVSLRPQLVKHKNPVNESNENKDEEITKKRNWKQDIAKRLSFTRSRIIKSFTIHKSPSESRSTKNIFQTMRRSISRIKSFDKNKSNKTMDKTSDSASAVLGSDCDYFTFDNKNLSSPDIVNRESRNPDIDLEHVEGTPLKPRRQFSQEKYLTGSKEILKRAFNSLKRKSQFHDDKSLFDICSTVSYMFCENLDEKSLDADEELIFRKIMNQCVTAFLDVHKKQIEDSIQSINKTIGEHIDLLSKGLEVINKSKKYQITELVGSKGVCIITNVTNKKQFIALKTSQPRSWIKFSGFLQHVEKDIEIPPGQEWICYPAQSITNLFIEQNFFSSGRMECVLILGTLTKLIVLLYCEMMKNSDVKINTSNVMLICSDLSLIFVFIECTPDKSNNGANGWLSLENNSYKDVKKSLIEMNKYIDKFLSSPENSCHLITASYPLDYLFFLLLKLNKDINILHNSI